MYVSKSMTIYPVPFDSLLYLLDIQPLNISIPRKIIGGSEFGRVHSDPLLGILPEAILRIRLSSVVFFCFMGGCTDCRLVAISLLSVLALKIVGNPYHGQAVRFSGSRLIPPKTSKTILIMRPFNSVIRPPNNDFYCQNQLSG